MFDAKTALDQLTHSENGIGRLKAMIGGKMFVAGDDFVQFGFKGCRKANKCRITLTPADTYTLQFYRFKPSTLECGLVCETSDLHAEDLRRVFEDVTGLYLSLNP